MIITRYDKPMGRVRVSQPHAESPPVVRRRDAHAMSWNQLCRTCGVHYHAWWYGVNRMGLGGRESLIRSIKHE